MPAVYANLATVEGLEGTRPAPGRQLMPHCFLFVFLKILLLPVI
jgi:hypothetical protein